MCRKMNRRQFLKGISAVAGTAWLAQHGNALASTAIQPRIIPRRSGDDIPNAQIAFVKTTDRTEGVRRALDMLGINPVQDKNLFVKPNYNSADRAPASTHNDTLQTLIEWLREQGVGHITVGDRAGMRNTQRVFEEKEVTVMAEEMGFDLLAFDSLYGDDWVMVQPEDSHWQNGFPVARPVQEADGVIQTCCLKTHRFGGHFTMSLKNSVGIVANVARGAPEFYSYMDELHGTLDQRKMIAEVNVAYEPDLIVLDGVAAFTSGGPNEGIFAHSQVVLAGTDRVAIDAVGVAILRHLGTTDAVHDGMIFEQEQIARAVELGLGVDNSDKIEIITDDADSAEYAMAIQDVLTAG